LEIKQKKICPNSLWNSPICNTRQQKIVTFTWSINVLIYMYMMCITYFLYTGSMTECSNWQRARATGGCSNTQCSGNRFVSCLAWFQSPTFSNASQRPNFWFAAYCIEKKYHPIKFHW
jgi:hypothetical protein